jgi:hypothetical protein
LTNWDEWVDMTQDSPSIERIDPKQVPEMHAQALLAVVSLVLVFVSSPSSAAPRRVTYQITSGSQSFQSGYPFTWNGGPVDGGKLVMTLSVPGCSSPPVTGSGVCLRSLTFHTTQGSVHVGYPTFTILSPYFSIIAPPSFGLFSPNFLSNFVSSGAPASIQLISASRYTPFDPTAKIHLVNTAPPTHFSGYFLQDYISSWYPVERTLFFEAQLTGLEILGPPAVNAIGYRGLIAFGVLIVVAPLAVNGARRRAATRRPA